jgi:hypothetical protein
MWTHLPLFPYSRFILLISVSFISQTVHLFDMCFSMRLESVLCLNNTQPCMFPQKNPCMEGKKQSVEHLKRKWNTGIHVNDTNIQRPATKIQTLRWSVIRDTHIKTHIYNHKYTRIMHSHTHKHTHTHTQSNTLSLSLSYTHTLNIIIFQQTLRWKRFLLWGREVVGPEGVSPALSRVKLRLVCKQHWTQGHWPLIMDA